MTPTPITAEDLIVSIGKALDGTVRAKILRALSRQNYIQLTELATEVWEPLATVSYHLKILCDCGVVQKVMHGREIEIHLHEDVAWFVEKIVSWAEGVGEEEGEGEGEG